MSILKELIDNLYEEVVHQPSRNDPTASYKEGNSLQVCDLYIDTERLSLTLNQMHEALKKDDVKDQLDPHPLDAEKATQLMIQWEEISKGIVGLKRHIQELDADIAKMQPWGDFDVVKLEQLKQQDCYIGFWILPEATFATQTAEAWYFDYQATLVSQDMKNAYFITISLGQERPQLPIQAEPVEICPCPVSTLIMLQTRDKDSLKRLLTRQGDFALAHYAELMATLRTVLPDDAAQIQRQHKATQTLRSRLKRLFKK